MNTMKDNLNLYQEAAKQGYESVRQLGELNLSVWNRMLDGQIDALGLWADAGARQMELLSTTKNYQEYLGAQAKLTRELAEGLMQKSRDALKNVGAAPEEYRAWAEASVNNMTGKFKAAAEATN
jgi:hypothetical protein